MRNLYFYVKTYGTKSFQEFPFNEVDSLLLSQLSYLNLDLVIPKIQEKSLLFLWFLCYLLSL